jgi:SAM-dependent methyltransferase
MRGITMVKVTRDFERIYAESTDPWEIGAADSARYLRYGELLDQGATNRDSILDIGCGFGAFLAHFREAFDRLVGVELSTRAIATARERHPFIEFHQASADDLAATPLDADRFGAIVHSDVIYYLSESARRRSLSWSADHLLPDGVALIAAWCPGGRYLTHGELRRLVELEFAIEHEERFESGHTVFVCRPRMTLVAITVDYETWQPIPEGRSIDWHADVFTPTERLLDAFDSAKLPLTLFAELGEHAFLRKHDPGVATRMEEQWAEAVIRGHDVQMHLHPTWLPELGARHTDGEWWWDWSRPRAHDYPGNLSDLISDCKGTLERAICPVAPDYRVTSFRAGAYEAQPFWRIYDALSTNGIGSDSSVHPGARHDERHYDYTLAYSDGQPYFASRYDPQLKAPPAERTVVELPLLSLGGGQRWSFDDPDCASFPDHLLGLLAARRRAFRSTEATRRRALFQRVASRSYHGLRSRGVANRLIPRRLAYLTTDYRPEALTGHDYCVLIGHTKADLDIDAISAGIRRLAAIPRIRFVTISTMSAMARRELLRSSSATPHDEADRQVKREYRAVMNPESNRAQSHRLQALIPHDRRQVLDVGCGAGQWAARIAELLPAATVTGVDAGADFIDRAQADHGSDRVQFAVEDFGALSFADASFDCVYADNTLEHAFDVDMTLRELARVLEPSGVLVAAIPADARNPEQVCDNHTWKTAPHDVRARLEHAGFVGVEIEEVDTFRALGMPPFPPSRDRMIYVRARRRSD